LATLSLLVALASGVSAVDQPRDADATITVSGSGATPLGMSLVEGRLRHRDNTYLLLLRGVASSTESVGRVYGLAVARDVAGSYAATNGALRNDRGVVIIFDPPLDLPSATLEIELASRVRPKASTGQRGTVE
jgi:hypothetical protein